MRDTALAVPMVESPMTAALVVDTSGVIRGDLEVPHQDRDFGMIACLSALRERSCYVPHHDVWGLR
jgi:hypothetical protein